MSDTIEVVAGRCRTVFEGPREQTQHGDALVIVKPDGTVLVHDQTGYQPLAWLTRAGAVTVTSDRITAQDGDQALSVTFEEIYARGEYPSSDAGTPVGDCSACDGTLVRSGSDISCLDCTERYSLPARSTVIDEDCQDCGRPLFRVERGKTFELCLDPACESLDDKVREVFDRKWGCPDCDGDLRVLRRGGLLLGCEHYPECETGFSFPTGPHVGDCDCGLPRFETPSGEQCLDRECTAGA